MWEHFVLNELHANFQSRKIQYWRDKQGHEIDFIIQKRGNPVAIECNWSADEFDFKNLRIFRRIYPEGENFVVAHDVTRSYSMTYD